MRRTAQQKRQRKLALSALLGMLGLAALLIWLDLPAPNGNRGLSGSMFANEAPTLDWEHEGALHSLDDPFYIRWAGATGDDGTAADPVRLFASRNDAWDASACGLGILEDSPANPGAKRFAPRSASCLDAGSWFLFAVQGSQVLHRFDEVLQISNGAAVLEHVDQVSETGFNGDLDIRLQMHRPAAEDGFDGVWNLPVDIWITDGKQVCVAQADPISVPRDPVRSGLSWKSTEHAAHVSLRQFRKVTDFSPFERESDIPSASGYAVAGECDIREGVHELTVGPTERAWVKTGQVFVHAAPASVDEDRLEITVPAGEVAEATLRLRNPSSRPMSWSAKAVSLNDAGWLIGFEDRAVKGSSRGRGVVTISATDLQPGRYDAELRVSIDDFYGTTTTIPVEINVVASRARSVGTDSGSDQTGLPGSVQLSNYPNPFSGSTTIRLELPESSDVRIVIYDMTGREVRQMHDGYLSMGAHEFRFDADNLPSGTYLYRVSTNQGQETGTMTLVH